MNNCFLVPGGKRIPGESLSSPSVATFKPVDYLLVEPVDTHHSAFSMQSKRHR